MTSAGESLSPQDIAALVSKDGSTIHADIYANPEIYQLELKNIFAKTWILLCPESQIPSYGDYFIAYMGEDPVIVVRQKDGTVAAFLNQCRHRGGSLCRGESGNARAFTCSYHGWSYDTVGTLTSIPLEGNIYSSPVDKSKWSARRVPQVEVHHGLVFGCWDESAPGFRESLGDAAIYFDLNFGRTDSGMEAFGGVYKWRIKANWKLAAEQFATDSYHFATTHVSALTALGGTPETLAQYVPGRSANDKGHGIGLLTNTYAIENMFDTTTGKNFSAYIRNTEQPQAIKRYGPELGSAYPVFSNFFPSMGYVHAHRSLRTWIPRGPDEMEVWAWTLTDKDAPQDIKDHRRRLTAQAFGPTGIFEQDDTANWVDVQRPLGGFIARQTRFNVEMGSGGELENWPGTIDIDISESSARSFYKRWRELMLEEGSEATAPRAKWEVRNVA